MILKGSQRGSGANLATHLLRTDDNEHVELHELRGFVSDDLHGAFQEAEAVSLGTQCRQYLFSLSLNPPEDQNVSVSLFEQTIDRVEERLGLEGQPRAVVFHEKEGRRHAHCVWSRTDTETMTARHLAFYKTKLTNLSLDIYLEQGWDLPKGLAQSGTRDPTNFSLAEWQQCKRSGTDPRWLKAAIQACWSGSDSPRAFEASLRESGFFLAKGDRRAHVVMDHMGEIYALPRMLGVKSKDVTARLGDGNNLPSVAETRGRIGNLMSPVLRDHVAAAKERFQARSDKLQAYRAEMTAHHRTSRAQLSQTQQRERDEEQLANAKRLPKGMRGLWFRLTGKYKQIKQSNAARVAITQKRHAQEQQDLIDKQLEQRRVLQERVKDLRRDQAAQLQELRKDISRYAEFAREAELQAGTDSPGLGLKLSP